MEEYRVLTYEFTDKFTDTEKEFAFSFKRPSVQLASKTQKQMMKDSSRALRNLCLECVKPEEKDDMTDAFNIYAGLPTTFGGAILQSSGFGDLGNG